MAATGELALLPVIPPARVTVLDANRAPARRPRSFEQPRVYRMPPRNVNARLAYGPGGHAVLNNAKGRIIDLYT